MFHVVYKHLFLERKRKMKKILSLIIILALVFSLAAYMSFYFIARGSVYMWRKYLAEKVRNSKIVKIVKQIPLIQKIASFMGD